MNLKLFVDCKNRKLVTSKTNDSEVTLEGLFREDTVNLQIFPVQATGVLTAPLEEVDITNITLKAGVGERDGTLQAFNDVWTKDLTEMSYTGSLNVNTTEINAELSATSAEVIEKWFELEFTEGTSITTVLQIKINITKDVIRASNVLPIDVEPPSEFVNTLNGILQSGLTVVKTTGANTITHHINGLENITQLEPNKIARVKADGSAFELVDETAVTGIPTLIEDLTNVDTSGVADGKILKYDDATSTWLIGDDIDTDTGAININELTDVDTTGLAAGKVLKYDDTTSTWVVGDDVNTGATALNDLTDVDTTGEANGKIIKHDGTSWVIADDDDSGGGGGSSTLDGLTDTDVGTKSDGQQLTWVDAESKWKAQDATASHTHTLDGLTDTDIGSKSDGQQLTWVDAESTWKALDATATHSHTLDSLSDVDTTGEANGKILKHDGTSWVIADDETAAQGSGADELEELLDVTFDNEVHTEANFSTWEEPDMTNAHITYDYDNSLWQTVPEVQAKKLKAKTFVEADYEEIDGDVEYPNEGFTSGVYIPSAKLKFDYYEMLTLDLNDVDDSVNDYWYNGGNRFGFLTDGLEEGMRIVVRIKHHDEYAITPVFPEDWKWLNHAANDGQFAMTDTNSTNDPEITIISLTAFGDTDEDVIASIVYNGS